MLNQELDTFVNFFKTQITNIKHIFGKYYRTDKYINFKHSTTVTKGHCKETNKWPTEHS